MSAIDIREEAWTIERLVGTVRSYQLPLVLLNVVRCGAFERLVQGPADAAELARLAEIDEDALSRLLNVLLSQGILEIDGEGRYILTKTLAVGFASTKIGSPLDGLKHTAEGLNKWGDLAETLLQGHAEYTDTEDVTRDPKLNEHFIRAMHAYAGPSAKLLVELLPREGAKSFLDLGGGPGTFSLALAQAWTDLHAMVADLPLTLRTTQQVIEEAGLSDRIHTLEADFYKDRSCDLGGPYDLALISAVIHAEGLEENKDLFRRMRKVVKPGGRIIVRERILAEGKGGPPASTLFDVHMLACTHRGRCYTESEIGTMLSEAGFTNPRLISTLDEGILLADG